MLINDLRIITSLSSMLSALQYAVWVSTGSLSPVVAIGYAPVFGFSSLRTPTTAWNLVLNRPIEGCAGGAGLAAGDDGERGHHIYSLLLGPTSD